MITITMTMAMTIQNGRVQVPRSASCMSFRCWRIWSTRIASCGMRLRVDCCIFSKVRPRDFLSILFLFFSFCVTYDKTKTTGTFAETTSPEHQMHWIIENCKTVRAADGLTVIVDALKLLSVQHEKIS